MHSSLATTIMSPELAVFVGGLTLGVSSNIYARIKDLPAAIIRMPGLLFLVPGSLSFLSIQAVMSGQTAEATVTAGQLTLVAISLVMGMVVAGSLMPPERHCDAPAQRILCMVKERGWTRMDKVEKSEEEWREQLSSEAYHVTRQAGTEPPFSGALLYEKGIGTFGVCAAVSRCSSPTASLSPAAGGRASSSLWTAPTWWRSRTAVTAW